MVWRWLVVAVLAIACSTHSAGKAGDAARGDSTSSGGDALHDSSSDGVIGDAATWPSAWTDLEDQVLPLLNQQRANGATCGSASMPPVPPLDSDPQLRAAARAHSLDMVNNAYFSHTSPDGTYIFQRIYDAGYTAWSTDENIAGDYKTAADVVAAWMASPGHCTAIMSVGYSFIPYQSSHTGTSEVGVGYATNASGGDWTLDFGWRSGDASPGVSATCTISPATVAASTMYTVSGASLAANESIWETYATEDGINSVGGGAGSAGTFTNTATASSQGGEGWVVIFDYATLLQIGRCKHL